MRCKREQRTGKAGNAVLLSEWFASAISINLCHNDLVLRVAECISQLFIDWGKVLCDVHLSNRD